MRLRTLLVAGLMASVSCGSGCPLPFTTRVAFVRIENDTSTTLTPGALLRGSSEFQDQRPLAPKDALTLIKYEEPVLAVTPIEQQVQALRLRTASGCIVRLDQAAVATASQRDKSARRWTIHLTPEMLSAQCGQ
jgi:hypothetical protein